MDKQRDPAILKRKKRNRMIAAVVVGLSVVALTVAVSRLEPAAPSVADSESVLCFGTVKRGPFTREVRGAGTLVPEEIRWITATTTGRVERSCCSPAPAWSPGRSSSSCRTWTCSRASEARSWTCRRRSRNMANQKATISQRATDPGSQHRRLRVGVSKWRSPTCRRTRALPRPGWCRDSPCGRSRPRVDRAKNQLELAKKQLASSIETAASQLAPTEAAVNQRRAEVDRLRRQLDDLRVKSTMSRASCNRQRRGRRLRRAGRRSLPASPTRRASRRWSGSRKRRRGTWRSASSPTSTRATVT